MAKPRNKDDQELTMNDVLFLDYHDQNIKVIPANEFEHYLETEELSIVKCIRQSLIDHIDRAKEQPIYVFNGYTVLLVKDFLKDPIQASVGQDNPNVDLSVRLFNLYDEYNKVVEVLNVHTGEIFKYLDLESALDINNHCLYDLIKININEVFESDIKQYCLPAINDKWIYRPVDHSVEWNQYVEYSIFGNL